MLPNKLQLPRHVATALLNQFEPQRQNLKDVLPKFLEQTAQRNILMDLAYGVIRNRELIDIVMETIGGVLPSRIQKKLLNIIRIGIFELIFIPDRADYAIVDAAVNEAKRISGQKGAGFVNALLRNIGRNIKNRSAFEFNIPILPDPKENPAKYLSMRFSLPLWLVEEWLNEFGFEQAQNICIASNRRPSVYLRPNAFKTTPQNLHELLQSNGIDCQLIAERGMIKINQAGDITQLPGFAEGLFVVQDLTASETVKMLAPQPNWTILDMCAAPGTKTTQLAELTADTGKILATDIDEIRLKRVETASKRLQMTSIRILPFANLSKTLSNEQCDAVLIDAPCSNTGVLSRRPEVRYRITSHAVKQLAQTQLELLNRATSFVKPGGKICYSTCSIQNQENKNVINQFLSQNNSFVLLEEKLSLPVSGEIDYDGGYTAILLKKIMQ